MQIVLYQSKVYAYGYQQYFIMSFLKGNMGILKLAPTFSSV